MKSNIRRDAQGNAWVVLPDELLEELGWKVGDNLHIEEILLADYSGEVYGILLEKVKNDV